jgi:hypothetical protein
METRSSVQEARRLQIIEADTDRLQCDETIAAKTMPDLGTGKQAKSIMILKATPAERRSLKVDKCLQAGVCFA